MITIYHNTRCGKSRCALEKIENLGAPFQIVEYMKTPPSHATLRRILDLLGKAPFDLIRQKEAVFQEKFKGKVFRDEEWIDIMIENPILIERPIVVAGDKAWIARNDETLQEMAAALGK